MRSGYRDECDVTPTQRKATLARRWELVDAAADALSAGFEDDEVHEVVFAPAKALRVVVWPALAEEIVRDARRMTPRTF